MANIGHTAPHLIQTVFIALIVTLIGIVIGFDLYPNVIFGCVSGVSINEVNVSM